MTGIGDISFKDLVYLITIVSAVISAFLTVRFSAKKNEENTNRIEVCLKDYKKSVDTDIKEIKEELKERPIEAKINEKIKMLEDRHERDRAECRRDMCNQLAAIQAQLATMESKRDEARKEHTAYREKINDAIVDLKAFAKQVEVCSPAQMAQAFSQMFDTFAVKKGGSINE
jgi:hypothetical protein